MIKQGNPPSDLISLAHTCTLSPSSCSSLFVFSLFTWVLSVPFSLNIAICCSFSRATFSATRIKKITQLGWKYFFPKLFVLDAHTFFFRLLRASISVTYAYAMHTHYKQSSLSISASICFPSDNKWLNIKNTNNKTTHEWRNLSHSQRASQFGCVELRVPIQLQNIDFE